MKTLVDLYEANVKRFIAKSHHYLICWFPVLLKPISRHVKGLTPKGIDPLIALIGRWMRNVIKTWSYLILFYSKLSGFSN
jgi:hypothetical protein